MYQEEIANLTAAHLRTHIQAYLDALESVYGDSVKLQFPKAIETDNLVGGVYNTSEDTSKTPAYAIDIISKAFEGLSSDSLWLYTYDGHIAGAVSGGSEESVNKMCKRHEQAVETYVREHQFLHLTGSLLGLDFSIRELQMTGAAFSGAELLAEADGRQTWYAGFRVDLIWTVSESGSWQHGT